MTILLVVLHHVCQELTAIGAGVEFDWWVSLDQTLIWIRMPLFFLLSGLFAARAVLGSGSTLWGDRVGRFVYLFVLWSLVHLQFYLVLAWVSGRDVLAEFRGRAWDLSIGLSPMWFILALAGFFAIARVARALSVWVQLAGAAALSAAVFVFDFRYPFEKVWLLVFFLLGCHCSRSVRRLAKVMRVDRVAGSTLVRPLRAVGARTLPICLLHVLILSMLPAITMMVWFGAATPVIETVVSASGALVVWLVLRRVHWLFDLPAWWKRAIG